jgi:hypothetical protein
MRRTNNIVAVVILATDYGVYYVTYMVGATLLTAVLILVNFDRDQLPAISLVQEYAIYWAAFLEITLGSIFFWAGFAPSLWTWLYVLALFVTRTLLRSEKLVNCLRWALDVEKNPFRSVGAVAATVAFIVSVVIILVSVEISRISAA